MVLPVAYDMVINTTACTGFVKEVSRQCVTSYKLVLDLVWLSASSLALVRI